MRLLCAGLAAALLAAGCVKRPVTAMPDEIRRHAPEIAESGRARLEVREGGHHEVTGDDVVDVETRGRTRKRLLGLVRSHQRGERLRLTLAELVAGCPDLPAGEPPEDAACLLDRITGTPVEVGTRRQFDGEGVARLGGFVMIAGLVSYCVIECDNPAATIGGAALVVGALLLLQPFRIFQ